MTLYSLTKHSDNTPPISLYTNPLPFYRIRPFIELWEFSIEHLRRVWHTDREMLPPPDPLSSPNWALHMFYLLRPILFHRLSLFFPTMLFEHPSVIYRFCCTCNRFTMWNFCMHFRICTTDPEGITFITHVDTR